VVWAGGVERKVRTTHKARPGQFTSIRALQICLILGAVRVPMGWLVHAKKRGWSTSHMYLSQRYTAATTTSLITPISLRAFLSIVNLGQPARQVKDPQGSGGWSASAENWQRPVTGSCDTKSLAGCDASRCAARRMDRRIIPSHVVVHAHVWWCAERARRTLPTSSCHPIGLCISVPVVTFHGRVLSSC
jgi:hypothetical protein